MKIFENLRRSYDGARNVTTFSADMVSPVDLYIERRLLDDVSVELTKLLANAYFEQHGAEILKRIQEKTIDVKLIQKVVENLRKELKDEKQNNN